MNIKLRLKTISCSLLFTLHTLTTLSECIFVSLNYAFKTKTASASLAVKLKENGAHYKTIWQRQENSQHRIRYAMQQTYSPLLN